MSKREEQKREADRLFEECRQITMALSDERLCEVLTEVPHRKWLQLDKETSLAIGIVCRRAAERIKQLNMAVSSAVETTANACKCNYPDAWHCAEGENLKACTCECHAVNTSADTGGQIINENAVAPKAKHKCECGFPVSISGSRYCHTCCGIL